ncbi:MAG: energy transducer TonB [Treponema sp.]|nr:energy transducer TonB [Treponema sp.]
MNEKLLRFIILAVTAAIHLVIIFFLVFDTDRIFYGESENARVMKVTDFAELPPPQADPEIPQVEEIAEVMIETDIPPVQTVVAAGTLSVHSFDNYLQMHQVSVSPQFDERMIISELVYPPIALRSGIEGRVILELFVDTSGMVQRVTILREDPEGRGFGEAAVRAFMGKKGRPAYANGEAVSCRYRYPLLFTIR